MKPKSLSASSIDVYEKCSKRWAAEYVGKRVQQLPSPPADLGTAVHAALEVHCTAIRTDGGEVPRLGDLLGWYDTAYWKLFADRSFYDDGVEMLKNWYARQDWEGRTVLSTEVKSHFDIKTSNRTVPVNFIMDRVDRLDSGDLDCVDYKGLALDTILPTPSGWTTIADVVADDWIMGGDGKPCRVVAKSEIHYNPCYELRFDDGSVIVADYEHRWEVDNHRGREIMLTKEVADNLYYGTAFPQRHQRIATVGMELPEVDLPIDPYVLGAWLGDGTAHSGSITKPLPALFAEIERRGYCVTVDTESNLVSGTRTVYGLQTALRSAGLLDNKHIPIEYLRSSREQRLDLVRGIMDTDGHWNPLRKRCVLVTVDPSFARQFDELICSLGWTAHDFEVDAYGFGIRRKAHQVWFTPHGAEVFIARRPEDYRPEGSQCSARRLIKSAEEVDTVPTQCLEVDSPTHTFLCGYEGIKTHNTQRVPVSREEMRNKIQPRLYALALRMQYPDANKIWVTYELLRFDKITISFTDDELRETYRYIQSVLARILADTNPQERINADCRYCIRKQVCRALLDHQAAGGALSIDDPVEAGKRRAEITDALKGLEAVKAELDEFIISYCQQNDLLEYDAGDVVVKLGAKGMRKVDPERVKQVVGAETLARYGNLSIKEFDRMLAAEPFDEETKSALRQLARKEYGGATVSTRVRV